MPATVRPVPTLAAMPTGAALTRLTGQGLAPGPARDLARALHTARIDLDAADGLTAVRRWALTRSVRADDLALLTARAATARLDTTPGITRHVVARRTRALLVTTAGRALPDLPATLVELARGERLEDAAARLDVPPAALTVAVTGWPTRADVLLDAALPHWRAGASPEDTAAAIGISRGQFDTIQRYSHRGLPPRARLTSAPALLGCTPAWLTRTDALGHLPAPDGRDRQGRWWWPDTLTTWHHDTHPHTCPHCPARFATTRGVGIHAGLTHPDQRP